MEEKGPLSNLFYKVNIILIPNPDVNTAIKLLRISSRISLMNVDAKILNKILAK